MTKRILSSIEPFTYENIMSCYGDGALASSQRFIKSGDELHLVKEIIDTIVTLESGAMSDVKLIINLMIKEVSGISYIILHYININKVIILYEDIPYEGSYYGDIDKWWSKSYKHITDYFNNIIDVRVGEAIDAINIDSKGVLAIVDKYALHNSRDLMLVHAIEKYATEMSIMLDSITNKDNKKLFGGVVKTLKAFISPVKEKKKLIIDK